MTRRARTMKKLKTNFTPERGAHSSRLATTVIVMTVGAGFAQTMDAVRVISRPLGRKVELPGEFVPYLIVPIHAKIPGFVEKVEVDRGSVRSEEHTSEL